MKQLSWTTMFRQLLQRVTLPCFQGICHGSHISLAVTGSIMLLLYNPSQVTIFKGLRLLWGCHLQNVRWQNKAEVSNEMNECQDAVLYSPEYIGMHSMLYIYTAPCRLNWSLS